MNYKISDYSYFNTQTIIVSTVNDKKAAVRMERGQCSTKDFYHTRYSPKIQWGYNLGLNPDQGEEKSEGLKN